MNNEYEERCCNAAGKELEKCLQQLAGKKKGDELFKKINEYIDAKITLEKKYASDKE